MNIKMTLELTPAEAVQVSNYLRDVVGKKTPSILKVDPKVTSVSNTVKRTYTKKSKRGNWTLEEIAIIKEHKTYKAATRDPRLKKTHSVSAIQWRWYFVHGDYAAKTAKATEEKVIIEHTPEKNGLIKTLMGIK